MNPPRVGWRLCLEQGQRVLSWSLIRASGLPEDPEYAVWSGLDQDPGRWAELATAAVRDGAEVWDSPLCDPVQERELATELGRALLPTPLREALADPGETRHTLTTATRGWCAAVPWEALAVGAGDTRLVERCRLRTEPHPLARPGQDTLRPGGTGHDAPPPGEGAVPPDGPADGLLVLDPGPLADDDPATAPLYPAGLPDDLIHLGDPDDVVLPGPEGLGVDDLAQQLAARRWRRFLYAGHVRPGTPTQPGNAALVLSDGLGPDLLSAYAWLAEPGRWPAPPRVALLGCSSGERQTVEDVGLVLAAQRAGASTVTATRWNLPSDRSDDERPFTELVRAVDAAHRCEDPAGRLRDWQLTELHRWRASGAGHHSPLVWAALSTTDVPRQDAA